jgi:hypothetical protein
MKQQSKWFAAVLAVACGLAAAGSAQAQSIGLSGIDVSSQGGYGGWLTASFFSGSSVGSAGTDGVEVVAPVSGGFGGTYLDLGGSGVPINANSTQVTLTFTVNGTASDYNWLSAEFNPNDGSSADYLTYSGSGNPGNPAGAVWNGNTASLTWDLTPAELGVVQGGSAVLYGFNIGVNPAVVDNTPNIDITFNSITYSAAPVPEPAAMALLGLGVSGLLIFRRRK